MSSFQEEEIMRNMDPRKAKIMKELMESAKGKGLKDCAPLIMQANMKLQEESLSFTPEESTWMLEFLTKDMSPQERAKVDMMKKMVKKRGGK